MHRIIQDVNRMIQISGSSFAIDTPEDLGKDEKVCNDYSKS